MKTFLSRCLLVFLIVPAAAAQHPYWLIENKGQWDEPVLFRSDIPGGAIFLEKQGVSYHFVDFSELHAAHNNPAHHGGDPVIRGHAIRMEFINSNPSPMLITGNRADHYYNYFCGNDPSRWAGNVHPTEKVYYRNVWNNIDMKYYTEAGNMKYDNIVYPGSDPGLIRFRYKGADRLELSGGRLIIRTSLGEIIEQKPYAYQDINGEKKPVTCAFELEGNVLSFIINSSYDASKPLVIDPILIFASYTGSTADNFGMTATYDNAGNFYTGGTAFNIGYPTTPGAYQVSTTTIGNPNITDVVITKFAPDGASMVYSTYLGGGTATSGAETVHSLIVNDEDELFLFGVTSSDDFPVTTGAYDTIFDGGTGITFPQNGTNFSTGTDIYVSKFNAAGSNLIGSTFIGGSRNDGVNNNDQTTIYDSLQFNYGDQFRGEIMIDDSGYCYIATTTRSPDFPIVNGFQSALNGSQDAVVFKFNPLLTNLEWSTYLGGSNKDAAYSLKVDDSLNVFVTGGTSSPDFPTTPGSLNPAYLGGKTDGFVGKISSDGSTLMRSTFIGTPSYDQSYFIETDGYFDIYLYGQTQNPAAYPVVNVAYSNPNSGQFITKLDSSLSTMIYSSTFGNGNGGINISPTAFLVDICGNVYISGWGASILGATPLTGMPITPNAYQSSSGDGFNFYISVFKTDFTGLEYATYFGGSQSQEHVDGGTSRFDDRGVIYQSVCAGCGGFDDFPTTPGAWSQTNNSTNCNNGVFKLDIQLPFTIADFDIPDEVCSNYDYQFTNNSIGGTTYLWNFGDGDTSTAFGPSHHYDGPGSYTVTLIVVDSAFITCVSQDTISKVINVIENTPAYSLPDAFVCSGIPVQIGVPPMAGNTYTWEPATFLTDAFSSNPFADPPSTTEYQLYIDDGVCIDTVLQVVNVDTDVPLPGFTMTGAGDCNGVKVTLTSTALNIDGVIYIINGDTLFPGDTTITIGFGQTVEIIQIAQNGSCRSSLTQSFTGGGFADYFDDIVMPNVFTPFGTPGLNDLFCPIGFGGQYCYEMEILNRWGRTVYESSADGPCWDGRIIGTLSPAVEGVYYYIINYAGKEESGYLHLIVNEN